MKLLLFIVLALCSGCRWHDGTAARDRTLLGAAALTAAAEDDDTERSRAGVSLPAAKRDWTIMVYLDGHNNLSPYAAGDVAEMTAAAGDGYSVVLCWDSDPAQEHGTTRKNGYYLVTPAGPKLLKAVPSLNMGDPKTACDFIDYATANFPADRHAWIFWNHGGGVDRARRGVCWDDGTGDHLDETAQRDILTHLKKSAGKKADLVGYDACLMGTVEVLAQLRDLASYIVSSEETIPGEGWDYGFLEAIRKKPTITPRSLSAEIVKRYGVYYGHAGERATLAAFNCTYAAAFVKAMDALSAAAQNDPAGSARYRLAANNVEPFGVYRDGSKECHVTRDLDGYLAALAGDEGVDEAARNRASETLALLRDRRLIPYQWRSAGLEDRAGGMAVTLKFPTPVFKKLLLSSKTNWDEFLAWSRFPDNDYLD